MGRNSKLLWRRFGLLFVDCPGASSRNPEEVFTKEERFTLNYSRPPGADWTYRAYTVNPNKYPDDPRLHLWSSNARVQTLAGRPFLFVSDMYGDNLQVYRFAPGHGRRNRDPLRAFRQEASGEGRLPHRPAREQRVDLDGRERRRQDQRG